MIKTNPEPKQIALIAGIGIGIVALVKMFGPKGAPGVGPPGNGGGDIGSQLPPSVGQVGGTTFGIT